MSKLKDGFADRQKTASEAKQALLAKMRPKAAQTDPQHAERASLRAAELKEVRAQRELERAAKKEAAAEAAQNVELERLAVEEAALQAKRGDRKERKALSAAEAKAKRDAKYAARQARR